MFIYFLRCGANYIIWQAICIRKKHVPRIYSYENDMTLTHHQMAAVWERLHSTPTLSSTAHTYTHRKCTPADSLEWTMDADYDHEKDLFKDKPGVMRRHGLVSQLITVKHSLIRILLFGFNMLIRIWYFFPDRTAGHVKRKWAAVWRWRRVSRYQCVEGRLEVKHSPNNN